MLLDEAIALAKRARKLKQANRFFVADDVHPQTLDVARTRAGTFGFELVIDKAEAALEHLDLFGVLLQPVGITGELHDYCAFIAALNSRKIISCVEADMLSLAQGLRDSRVAHECILASSTAERGHRHQRNGYRQTLDRLWFPRPHHVFPGGQYADGRAHRIGKPAVARSLH